MSAPSVEVPFYKLVASLKGGSSCYFHSGKD